MLKLIILCEAHFDPIARELTNDNLDYLSDLGYQVFGFEHDYDKSIDFEIESLEVHQRVGIHVKNLIEEKKLSRKIFPLQILEAESNQALLHLLKEVRAHGWMYQGLDICLGNRFQMSKEEVIAAIELHQDDRDDIMACRLMQLCEEVNGAAIAIVGVNHMKGIQERIIDLVGLQAAKEKFMFIVPFSSVMPPGIMDLRREMLELRAQNKTKELQKYTLLPTTLFNKYDEDNSTESANERFQNLIPPSSLSTSKVEKVKSRKQRNRSAFDYSQYISDICSAAFSLDDPLAKINDHEKRLAKKIIKTALKMFNPSLLNAEQTKENLENFLRLAIYRKTDLQLLAPRNWGTLFCCNNERYGIRLNKETHADSAVTILNIGKIVLQRSSYLRSIKKLN